MLLHVACWFWWSKYINITIYSNACHKILLKELAKYKALIKFIEQSSRNHRTSLYVGPMHISKILLPGLLDKEEEILSTLLHIEDAFEHSQSVNTLWHFCLNWHIRASQNILPCNPMLTHAWEIWSCLPKKWSYEERARIESSGKCNSCQVTYNLCGALNALLAS